MSYLELYRLKCHKTYDLGEDEAYIEVNGARVWGPYSMDDGEEATFGGVVGPIWFAGEAAIDLYDDIGGLGARHFGRVLVRDEMQCEFICPA